MDSCGRGVSQNVQWDHPLELELYSDMENTKFHLLQKHIK